MPFDNLADQMIFKQALKMEKLAKKIVKKHLPAHKVPAKGTAYEN